MKIKEFLKDCVHCDHVWLFVCSIDELGKRQFDAKAICNFKDLDDFIDDYGDEEFKDWTIRECVGNAEITFYLKS